MTRRTEHFSTLVLSQHREYIDASAEGHCLIQRWQPKLNYPFVTKELVKKAHDLVPIRQQPHLQRPADTLAKQLFKKLRRRIQGQRKHLQTFCPSRRSSGSSYMPYPVTLSKSTTFQENFAVASMTRTVTLLYRMANHMEQPWRTKARARLRRVLKFRNASVSKFNMPRKVPLLAHDSFKKHLQNFVNDIIQRQWARTHTVPLTHQDHPRDAAPDPEQSSLEPQAEDYRPRQVLEAATLPISGSSFNPNGKDTENILDKNQDPRIAS